MKRRVLTVLSILVISLVALVSTVILSSSSRELTQALQLNRSASLNRIVQVASEAANDGDTTTLQHDMDTYSGLYGEALVIRLQDDVLVSGELDPQRSDVRAALDRASLNLSDTQLDPLAPSGQSTELISQTIGNGTQVFGEAVMEVNRAEAQHKLLQRWLLTAVSAVVIAAVLLFAAARFTAWVLRPVRRLGAAVHALEQTGQVPGLPADGPPELRELSRSFESMAGSLGELIESQRQLIADTSHHLRNPVGALRLRVDLLLLTIPEGPAHEAGAGVLAELDRVEDILESVLDLAMAEHRAIEGTAIMATPAVASTHVNPVSVLREEVDRALPAAQAIGSTITMETPEQSVREIWCNQTELAHIISELLKNAIKYAPGTPVIASVVQDAQGTLIEIADQGPGLTPEEIELVTTRFWRASEHATTQGTGLGMTIVKNLASANGARLMLRSNSPHGLRAQLIFPTAPTDEPQESRL